MQKYLHIDWKIFRIHCVMEVDKSTQDNFNLELKIILKRCYNEWKPSKQGTWRQHQSAKIGSQCGRLRFETEVPNVRYGYISDFGVISSLLTKYKAVETDNSVTSREGSSRTNKWNNCTWGLPLYDMFISLLAHAMKFISFSSHNRLNVWGLEVRE